MPSPTQPIADAVERAEPLADRHRVGERLARVLELGQRVDHRDRAGLGPRLELVVRERADRERVDVAREHLRRVLERLAARQLHLVGQQRDRRAAELRDRDRERDAGARRRLAEEEAERAAGEERARRRLEVVGRVEDRGDLLAREVGDPQQVAAAETHCPALLRGGDRSGDVAEARRGRRRLEGSVAHRRGDLLVRVAERDALADERLGRVGRAQQRVRARGGEPLAVEREAAHHHGQRAERARHVAARGEDRRLVLLQVAVVGERQALHRREQAR